METAPISCIMSLPLRWRGPVGTSHRVQRGRQLQRSYNNEASNARCAARNRNNLPFGSSERQQRVAGGVVGPFTSRAARPAGNAVRPKACPKASRPRSGGEARPVPGRASPEAGRIATAPHPAAPTVWCGAPLNRGKERRQAPRSASVTAQCAVEDASAPLLGAPRRRRTTTRASACSQGSGSLLPW